MSRTSNLPEAMRGKARNVVAMDGQDYCSVYVTEGEDAETTWINRKTQVVKKLGEIKLQPGDYVKVVHMPSHYGDFLPIGSIQQVEEVLTGTRKGWVSIRGEDPDSLYEVICFRKVKPEPLT